MKYKAVKGVSWRDYVLFGVEAKPVVIDPAEQTTKDGKPLPKEVIAVFVSQGNWLPCDDDGNPLEKE
jgi:hypothetical protein